MRTAVVTGASYGIGESIAKALLKAEWKVYCISRSKPQFSHDNFIWIKCDLSDSEKIADCLQSVTEPEIEALICNAGIAESGSATSVTLPSYTKTFSVNVLAPMLVVNALKTKITRSVIVSISSVSDRIPEADSALYCSSKSAITMYFNTLAEELTQAKVINLLPDYVDTPMQHRSNDNNENFDWDACIDVRDIAKLTTDLIDGKLTVESGANIIIVTEKLKQDLISVEKLYGFNTNTSKLVRL
jgi:short-subunit dehydrogenase